MTTSQSQTVSQQKSGHWTEIVMFSAVAMIALAQLIAYRRSSARLSVTEIALRSARQNPAVKELFGEPLQAQHPISRTANREEIHWKEAKLNVPIYGTKKKGMLRIVADKGVGTWVFSRLEVVPNNEPGAVIDLLTNNVPQPTQDGSRKALIVRMNFGSSKPPEFIGSVETIRPTLRHSSPVNEFEVDLQTGIFILRQTDLFVPDTVPLGLTRTYRSQDGSKRAFGIGTNHPYDIWPTGTRNPYTEMNLNLEDGSTVYFSRISEGTGFRDAVYRHDETSSEFYRSQFFWNGDGWTLRLADLRKILFPEAYNAKNAAQGSPIEMEDEAGNRVSLQRDSERNLVRLVSPSGRSIGLKHNAAAQIEEADDDRGHSRQYAYGSTGHLESVSDERRLAYRFIYQRLLDVPGLDSFLMTDIRDDRGTELLHLVYDRSGRVASETIAENQVFRFEYSFVNKGGRTTQITTVILPNGEHRTVLF